MESVDCIRACNDPFVDFDRKFHIIAAIFLNERPSFGGIISRRRMPIALMRGSIPARVSKGSPRGNLQRYEFTECDDIPPDKLLIRIMTEDL